MLHGKLLIGWSKTDITPPRKTLIQGQFHARISDTVLSPLTATALAFEVRTHDGSSDQAVLISCDLTNETFKDALVEALEGRCPGLDLEKISINTTHTHTAPATTRGTYVEPENDPDFMNPDEYRKFLVTRLAQAVETAWLDRSPGLVSRGFSYAMVARCRRTVYADGSAMMYGQTDRKDFAGFESCNDNSVNMLFTHNPEGELTGMLVNLACPSQCRESLEAISADYWHEVREAIAETYGKNVNVLPLCAPAGDMSPHLLADQTEEADLRNRLGVDDCGIISRRIMAALAEGLESASPAEDTINFAHEVETWHLPKMKVTEADYELEKSILTMSEAERKEQRFPFQRIWPFGPVCNLITRYEQQADNPEHEVESHIIRIGDTVFATSPFELYVDYAARIRCRSNALQTFLVQLANGSGFYLPTQRALGGGHYSAQIKSCWVGPEGGQRLVEKSIEAINKMFTDEPYPKTR